MRDRRVTVFFAGFASGLVFLAALLWGTGKLRVPRAPASAYSPLPRETQAAPQLNPSLPGPPKVEPAPLEGTAPPTPEPQSGGASRSLIIPVQGAKAADIHDNFNDMRGAHRHEAIDIMAPRGTPVVAAAQGNVVKLFLSKPGGLTVYQFDDSRTYCYYYAHLDRYAPGLKEGMLLRQGDILGYVGSSGDASPNAPHLHFAIFRLGPEHHWWQGVAIDPYVWLTGRAR